MHPAQFSGRTRQVAVDRRKYASRQKRVIYRGLHGERSARYESSRPCRRIQGVINKEECLTQTTPSKSRAYCPIWKYNLVLGSLGSSIAAHVGLVRAPRCCSIAPAHAHILRSAKLPFSSDVRPKQGVALKIRHMPRCIIISNKFTPSTMYIL